jgi:hypothetical protein
MMRPVNIEEPLLDYYQVDWTKPPPVIPQLVKRTKLTEYEAWSKNQAFALNGVSLRWVKDTTNASDVD